MRELLLIAGLGLSMPAVAGEDDYQLADAPGRELVEANCVACHSPDYIEMNSPMLDREKWDATVKKMVDRFGAPIEPGDLSGIVEYLATNYGP